MKISRFEEPLAVPKDRALMSEYILGISENAVRMTGNLMPMVYCIFDRPLGIISDEKMPQDTSVAMMHMFETEDDNESPADGLQPVVDEEQPDGIVFVSVAKGLTGATPGLTPEQLNAEFEEKGRLMLLVASHFKGYDRLITVPYSIVENQAVLHEQETTDTAKTKQLTELKGKVFSVKLTKETTMSPYG